MPARIGPELPPPVESGPHACDAEPPHASLSCACVVLFDIDGTLVTGAAPRPTAGVSAMASSSQEVTGVDELHKRVEFAGRTDRQIARDLLAMAGDTTPSPDKIDRLLGLYLDYLERHVVKRPYRPLGAVRDAVVALRASRAIVGLGTGNIRRGAGVKLRSAGLDDLFDLELGGFGDDAESRDEVLRIGAVRCDPTGTLPVVVVGDTPHDVRAAHDISARCVAVPTGLYGEGELREAGADAIVPGIEPSIVAVVAGLLHGGGP
jgi:phosphoglycolate phosphatase-like HAD superfamily hydrolase